MHTGDVKRDLIALAPTIMLLTVWVVLWRSGAWPEGIATIGVVCGSIVLWRFLARARRARPGGKVEPE